MSFLRLQVLLSKVGGKMKTLSIKQPFAEMIVSGKKTIEVRSWNTQFRGEFLVHASMQPDRKAMKRFGYTNLPTGIIGKVTLVDVKEYTDDFEADKDKHHARSDYGKFGFVLSTPVRLKEIIPAKGRLGFWEYLQ